MAIIPQLSLFAWEEIEEWGCGRFLGDNHAAIPWL